MPEYYRGQLVPTEQEYNRRQILLKGFTAGAGLLGTAGVIAAIRQPMPVYEVHNHATPLATVESLPISTVEDEVVEKYRQQYAVFGDTSQVDVELIDDEVAQEIEYPRIMITSAIRNTNWLEQDGFKWKAYGDYKGFVENYFADHKPGASIARDLFNPYSYTPSARFDAVQEERASDMINPDELFAATMTTWGLYPEAFLDRYNDLPMVDNFNDLNPDQPDKQPSWEKYLVAEHSKHALALAIALVKEKSLEGEGAVKRKLASVAPRLWDVAFMFEHL